MAVRREMGCIIRHWFTESYDISAVYEHVIAIRTGLLFLTHDKVSFSACAILQWHMDYVGETRKANVLCLERILSSAAAKAVLVIIEDDFHLPKRIRVPSST